ncbi:uncharacterized protein LOC135120966, partial [Zophobas morio]|uniref:uncharacterized protein LOC135120966 n=1 Tax=Zophobas morio TaxID=2755281 RepID=UPI00308328B4
MLATAIDPRDYIGFSFKSLSKNSRNYFIAPYRKKISQQAEAEEKSSFLLKNENYIPVANRINWSVAKKLSLHLGQLKRRNKEELTPTKEPINELKLAAGLLESANAVEPWNSNDNDNNNKATSVILLPKNEKTRRIIRTLQERGEKLYVIEGMHPSICLDTHVGEWSEADKADPEYIRQFLPHAFSKPLQRKYYNVDNNEELPSIAEQKAKKTTHIRTTIRDWFKVFRSRLHFPKRKTPLFIARVLLPSESIHSMHFGTTFRSSRPRLHLGKKYLLVPSLCRPFGDIPERFIAGCYILPTLLCDFEYVSSITEFSMNVFPEESFKLSYKSLLMPFTSSSCITGKYLTDNERLEFLGDSWLKYFVTILTFESENSIFHEGILSKIRAGIVSNNNLAACSLEVNIPSFIRTVSFQPGGGLFLHKCLPSFLTPGTPPSAKKPQRPWRHYKQHNLSSKRV